MADECRDLGPCFEEREVSEGIRGCSAQRHLQSLTDWIPGGKNRRDERGTGVALSQGGSPLIRKARYQRSG